MRFKQLILGASSAMVLGSLAAGGQAFAQDSADDNTVFGELVVTAQKREQRLQDVPIVVTVATEQLLKDSGVKDIRELTVLTPGLTVTSTSSEASVTARIRGIGTVGDNPGLESSVGIVIDGVYRPRNGVGFGDLGNMSRIEVLKGPQGTLFGKNTSAGVINILTKEPSFTPQADLEATAGNFSAFGASAYVTGALSPEKVAGSFFIAGRQRDGITDIQSLGANVATKTTDQNYYTLRGQLLALPNERMSARFIVDYSHRDESCCAAPQLFVGRATGNRGDLVNATKAGSIDLTNTPFDRIAYANRPYLQDITDQGVSAEINYDINDNVTVTSVTAWRSNKAVLGSDSDYTAADIFYIPTDGTNNNRFQQFSQEFRIAGEIGALNWLVGGFAAKEDLDSNQALNYGNDFYGYLDQRVLGNAPLNFMGLTQAAIHTPGKARLDVHNQEDRTLALFTNNDFKVTDALTATFGLRYTSDKKEAISRYTTYVDSCQKAETSPVGGVGALLPLVGGLCVPFMNADFDALGPNRQTTDESELTGTFKLAYRFTPDIMAYGSASRGYKAGGFNLDREPATCGPNGSPVTATTTRACIGSNGTTVSTDRAFTSFLADKNTAFAPEIVESYEGGVKTQWFDNSLLINVTAFQQTYTNFQLNTFVSPAFVVVTLPEVVSKGVDADIFWNTPVEGLSIQGGGTIADTIVSNFTAAEFPNFVDYQNVVHMQNRRLSFAPKYTASLSVSYEMPLTDTYQLRANLSGKYNSGYNTGSDLAPLKIQEEYTVMNGRVGIGPKDDRWIVELWAQNLMDKDYIQVAFNGPFMVTSNAAQFVGQDPSVVNGPTSVYNAYLGAPRTYGLTLRAKLK